MTVNLVVMLLSEKVLALLSPTTLKVTATVSGLLLAALAVQMVIGGLTEFGIVPAATHSRSNSQSCGDGWLPWGPRSRAACRG
jgi:hypothetical protein